MVLQIENRMIIVGIVIGLLVGAGSGYIYCQSSIAEYKEEVDRLETDNLDLQGQQEQLQEEIESFGEELQKIQELEYELNQTLKQIIRLQQQIEYFEQDQLLAQQRIQELEQELTEKLTKELQTDTDKTQYVSLEILVAIFLNVTQDGIRYDLVGANLDKVYRELETVRRFYWVNSHCKLNLNLTFLIIDKPISFSGWWLEPNVVNPVLQSALKSVGQNLSDYDGEIAIWASPGYTDEEEPPGGVGGGGGTVYRYSSFAIGGSVSWLMIHEFHHQLDEFFDKSGYPEYRFNHPREGGAEDPENYGEHFDVNAYILRIWHVKNWLELRDLPDFSPTIRETDDSDGDGIPDDDQNVPIDESRFGSDPRLVDTDGDRLNDLDELMAGIYSSSNPNNIDTDGDGLIDGLDPYPLYPLDPWIPKKTIQVDGELESEWYSFTDNFTYLNTHFKSLIKLSWDDDYLYIGIETDNYARIFIYIDANNDGWFHGKDNYEIIVDPSYTDQSFIIDKAHIWDCTKATEGLTWNEQIITKKDIKRAAKKLGSGYAVELAIAKNVETGLLANESSKIGLRFEFDYIGRDGKLWGTSFERWTFVYITLGTRPDHT